MWEFHYFIDKSSSAYIIFTLKITRINDDIINWKYNHATHNQFIAKLPV